MVQERRQDLYQFSVEELRGLLPGLDEPEAGLIRQRQEVQAQIEPILQQLSPLRERLGEVNSGLRRIERQRDEISLRIAQINEVERRRKIFAQALRVFQQSGVVTLVETVVAGIPGASVKILDELASREWLPGESLVYPSVTLIGPEEPFQPYRNTRMEVQKQSHLRIWVDEQGQHYIAKAISHLDRRPDMKNRIVGSGFEWVSQKPFDPTQATQLLDQALVRTGIKNPPQFTQK